MSNICLYKEFHKEDNVKLRDFNKREILRYAGAMNSEDEGLLTIMDECIEEVMSVLSYKVSYRVIENIESIEDLPFNTFGSNNLKTNLENCGKVVLFAATIGIGIDRLIAKYSRVSPTKGLFLQAIGAERIEALCDTFEDFILDTLKKNVSEEHIKLHPRFSPGYGDLPLETQKEMFGLLDCERRLGLTLNESLLMSPSKSVTAIIGVEKIDCVQDFPDEPGHKCENCSNTECEYRNKGKFTCQILETI